MLALDDLAAGFVKDPARLDDAPRMYEVFQEKRAEGQATFVFGHFGQVGYLRDRFKETLSYIVGMRQSV